MNKKFWAGKNVLITGYQGFLGSWISKRLLETKANIFGIDKDVKFLGQDKKTILTCQDCFHIDANIADITDYFKL